MKLFFILLLFFVSNFLFLLKTYAGINPSDYTTGGLNATFQIGYNSSNVFSLYMESGDTSNESSPPIIYIPVTDDAAVGVTSLKANNFTVAKGQYSSTSSNQYLPLAGAAPTYHMIVNVKHDQSTARDICVAVNTDEDDGEEYEVLNCQADVAKDTYTTTLTVSSSANSEKICGGTGNGCSLTGFSCSQSSVQESKVYIFHTDSGNTSMQMGDSITPSEYSGKFYELHFSSQFSSSSSCAKTAVAVTNIKKGDTELSLELPESSITFMQSDDLYQTLALRFDSSECSGESCDLALSATYRDVFASETNFLSLEALDPMESGNLYIRDLENGTRYCFGIAQVNKFQFVTYPSTIFCETPREIATLINKQSCYILSAGFQREHPTVDYFMHFRDHFLLKRSWGKKLVNFYYSTAPKYTEYIIQGPALAFFVRTFANSLKWVMEHTFYRPKKDNSSKSPKDKREN